MAETKKNSSNKVFDIATKTPASPTSRPIIVGHGPLMKDPTLVEESKPDDPGPAKEKQATVVHELKIQPLEGHDLKPEPEPAKKEDKSEVSPSNDVKPETEEKAKSDSESTVAAADEKPTEVSDKEKERLEKEEQSKQAARQARVDQYVQTEKYFLPINQVEKRRNRRVVFLGVLLCLLLAIGWLDVALDAGLIANSYHLPHTHFFSLSH